MASLVQLQAHGSLTIPSDLRRKYGLDEGAVFTLVDLGDGSFLLSPKVPIAPQLVAELEALREEAGLSLDDLLSGLPEVRRQLFLERRRRDA